MSARSRSISNRRLRYPDMRISLAVLLLAVAVTPWFESLDIYLAREFYNADTGQWLVPKGRPPIWHVLYLAPKILLVLIAVCLFVAFACGFYLPKPRRYRSALLLSLLALGLVPSLVAGLKNVTDIYCPIQTAIFGGTFPNIEIFEAYPPDIEHAKPGRCWPAAHASGGFALMGITIFANRSNWRRRLFLTLPGFTLGWAMGLFQMARGHHYLSHTLVSLGLALLTIWAVERWFTGRDP